MIFNASGGGAPLNFKVLGGTSQPSGQENTIWVNTDAGITSWVFAPTAPETPAEGMVWFSTGQSSVVAFNALRKNTITVCPLAAKQYIGDKWEEREAMSYQGGEWRSWIRYLYNNGDACTENGGDWAAAGKNLSSDGGGSSKPTMTMNGTNMVMTLNVSGNKGGIVYKEQAIDLTGVSTINIKGKRSTALSLETWTSLNVWSSLGTYIVSNRAANLNFGKDTGTLDLNLDVSRLTGEHYIGFGLYGNQTLTITEVSLA